MAILDNELIMSNAQAVTAIAANAATNDIDFGRAGSGYNKKVLVSVNTTAVGASSTVVFSVITDDNAAFSSPVTLVSTAALPIASLTAGKKILEYTLPAEVEQYVRVTYTIAVAVLTAGKFNAWIDDAQQTNMLIM